MKYFPDEPTDSVLAKSAVIAVPLFYLGGALNRAFSLLAGKRGRRFERVARAASAVLGLQRSISSQRRAKKIALGARPIGTCEQI